MQLLHWSDRFKEHTNLRNKEAGNSSSFSNHLNTGQDCDISNLSIQQKAHKLARAQENGKALLNEQLEFNISPLLKLAIDC